MTFDRSPTEIDLHLRARDQARQHVAPTAERRDHDASWNDAAFVALAALWATAIDADGRALFALFDGLGEGGLDAGFAAACAAHVLAGRVLAGAGTAPGAGLHALVAGDWSAGFTPAALPVRATMHADGWALAGVAQLVAGAPVAEAFVVLAGAGDGTALFLVERGAVAITATPSGVLRTCPVGTVAFSGVRASPLARLDAAESQRLLAEIQNSERLLCVAPWPGLLRALHALSTAHLQSDPRALASQRHRILLADLEIAALLCHAAVDQGAPCLPGEVSVALAATKLVVETQAREATRLAVSLLGAVGLGDGHPAVRLARDALTLDVRVGDGALTRSVAALPFFTGSPGAASPPVAATSSPVRRFAELCRERIEPRAAEIDAAAAIPAEVWAALAESGYLRFFHPEALGGLGLGSEDLVVALELLGAACPALAWKATVSANICGRVLAQHGSPEHLARWLAPILSGDKVASIGIVESVGSDLGSNTTVATRVGGEWVVRGGKATVTNGPIADVCLLFTRMAGTEAEAGLLLIDTQSRGVSAEPLALTGARGMPWGPVRFDDVRVADSEVLFSGPLPEVTAKTLSFIEWGLLFQSACSLGIASSAIRAVLAFHAGRPAYGGKMLHLGHIHGRIAELAAHVHAARRLVLAAMRQKSAGADATSLCRLAKAYTSELSVRVAVEAVRLHGSAGVRPGWPAERILRDSLPNFYGGQSSDMLRDIAVGSRLGAAVFATPTVDWLAASGFGGASSL